MLRERKCRFCGEWSRVWRSSDRHSCWNLKLMLWEISAPVLKKCFYGYRGAATAVSRQLGITTSCGLRTHIEINANCGATDALPSRALQSTGFRSTLACVRLSSSCPFRLLHTLSITLASEALPPL